MSPIKPGRWRGKSSSMESLISVHYVITDDISGPVQTEKYVIGPACCLSHVSA